jgi:hypothetical protein
MQSNQPIFIFINRFICAHQRERGSARGSAGALVALPVKASAERPPSVRGVPRGEETTDHASREYGGGGAEEAAAPRSKR